MIVAAVVYVCSVIGFVVGIATSPGHLYRGWPAILNACALLVSGLVLAIGRL